MVRVDIITIFPKVFEGIFGESIVGRAQEKKKVKGAKLSFDDDDITGDLRRPTNSFLISRQKAKLPPLIKFREHFRKELHASTENY